MENQKSGRTLPIKSMHQAIDEAKVEIEEGRSGRQPGLLCRWPLVNRVILGSWRFANTYIIGGMSGGGKSYFINMLRKDFLDSNINANFKKKFRLIHFAFEMSASNEVLREVGGRVKEKYEDLISAYSRLSDVKYKKLIETLNLMKDLDMDFVEVTGNVDQIKNTIYEYQARYPEHLLVITLDHTLLTDYKDEAGEIALVTKLSKMFVGVRKKIHSMNILVANANTELEDIKRITTPTLHYPVKRDLHGAKAIFRDADIVMFLHTPEKLGIARYGNAPVDEETGYPTKDMVFNHVLKVRNRTPGIIRFKQDYANGNLIEIQPITPPIQRGTEEHDTDF